jgi:hypothetical protein
MKYGWPHKAAVTTIGLMERVGKTPKVKVSFGRNSLKMPADNLAPL